MSRCDSDIHRMLPNLVYGYEMKKTSIGYGNSKLPVSPSKEEEKQPVDPENKEPVRYLELT